MDLVFVYGPPGVGKSTVAQALAKLTGFKDFDNHLTIECVLLDFDFGTAPFNEIVFQLRLSVLERAAIEGVSTVFTYVHGGSDGSLGQILAFAQAVERHDGRVCFVRLSCDEATNEQRVVSPERSARGNIDSVERLRAFAAVRDFTQRIPGRDSLEIDNTDLKAGEVATKIREHFGLPVAAGVEAI